jgi:hypothetical protein
MLAYPSISWMMRVEAILREKQHESPVSRNAREDRSATRALLFIVGYTHTFGLTSENVVSDGVGQVVRVAATR